MIKSKIRQKTSSASSSVRGGSLSRKKFHKYSFTPSNDYGLVISNEIDVITTTENEDDSRSDLATINTDDDDEKLLIIENNDNDEYYPDYEFQLLFDRLKERIQSEKVRKRKIDSVADKIGKDFSKSKNIIREKLLHEISSGCKIEKSDDDKDSKITTGIPSSIIFEYLKIPCGFSYTAINPNYFRFIHRMENVSLQEMFEDFEQKPKLYTFFKKIGPKILNAAYGSANINKAKFIHEYQEAMFAMLQYQQMKNLKSEDQDMDDDDDDDEVNQAIDDEFDSIVQSIDSAKTNKFRNAALTLDPLLESAMSLKDFQYQVLGVKEENPRIVPSKYRFIFKCWTCKYYYRFGQTQQEFFQFQFKDFCSIRCLTANVRNNGRCTFCYRQSDPATTLLKDSPLDWQTCSYTLTFYHPEDLGQDYLETFHNQQHYQRYLESNRRCHICQIELLEDLGDTIKSLRMKYSNNETRTLYFCHKHQNEISIRSWSGKSTEHPPKCTTCFQELTIDISYPDDQFFDKQNLVFCTKYCKLFYFKQKQMARQNHYDCSVCYRRITIDHGNYDDQFRYYLIRCLWTWYPVCSPRCYQKFRHDYGFNVDCEQCSLASKSHSDMISIMQFNAECKSSPLEIKHYCSLKCFIRMKKLKSISTFHPLPIRYRKYTCDTRFERDIIDEKCLKCSQKFLKMRGSLWQFCSYECFHHYHRVNYSMIRCIFQQEEQQSSKTDEQLFDSICCTEISKKLSSSSKEKDYKSQKIDKQQQQQPDNFKKMTMTTATMMMKTTTDVEQQHIKQSRLNTIRKKISQKQKQVE